MSDGTVSGKIFRQATHVAAIAAGISRSMCAPFRQYCWTRRISYACANFFSHPQRIKRFVDVDWL
jgi:hypothetical protein